MPGKRKVSVLKDAIKRDPSRMNRKVNLWKKDGPMQSALSKHFVGLATLQESMTSGNGGSSQAGATKKRLAKKIQEKALIMIKLFQV